MKINTKMGLLSNTLEAFVTREEVTKEHLSMAFIAGGQGGGKITTEFCRLGYDGIFYNTCKEDLLQAEQVLKEAKVPQESYKVIRLEKYDGASKDRAIGLQAIRDNIGLLQSELIADQRIVEADFVWIVVALGGGTGNGSVSTIAQIVSSVMRSNKRYKMKYEGGELIDQGKPTVGIIAAVPEEVSGHQQKLNAAECLQEIRVLQENSLIGSVLLVDNEKLIENFLQKEETETRSYDWVTYGNTTVAQLIGENAAMTCLPGKETLDKSEVLDIWSTPGYLSIGKNRLSKSWLIDYIEKYKCEDEQEVINMVVQESFVGQNIFADGYNYDAAIHGGLAIIAPKGKVISVRNSLMFKKALNKVLGSPELVHFGIFENEVFGTFGSPKTDILEAVIYTMAITKELPARIYTMVKEALERKQKYEEQRKSNNDTDLGQLIMQNKSNTPKVVSNVQQSLDSIMSGSLFKAKTLNKETQKEVAASIDDKLKEMLGKKL